MDDDIPIEVQNSKVLRLELLRTRPVETSVTLEEAELHGIMFKDISAFIESEFPGWEVYKMKCDCD